MRLSERHNVGSTFVKKKRSNTPLAVAGSALLMRNFWDWKFIVLLPAVCYEKYSVLCAYVKWTKRLVPLHSKLNRNTKKTSLQSLPVQELLECGFFFTIVHSAPSCHLDSKKKNKTIRLIVFFISQSNFLGNLLQDYCHLILLKRQSANTYFD